MTRLRILLVAASLPLLLTIIQCRSDRRSTAQRADSTGVATTSSAGGDSAAVSEFSSGSGSLTSLAFDEVRGRVWIYVGGALQSFSTQGRALDTIPSPGERADDIDLEVAPESLSLAGVTVPAGTLLVINGESGPADIYAVDSAGTVLATLATEFGAAHVVGGAWHPARNTFFLVQDNQPAADQANRVAEIDPATGRVLRSFSLGTHSVHYGDLDITAGGNIVVASSSQSQLAEFTPEGTLVRYIALPANVSSISGIGLDQGGNAWACSTGGLVWRLAGIAR